VISPELGGASYYDLLSLNLIPQVPARVPNRFIDLKPSNHGHDPGTAGSTTG